MKPFKRLLSAWSRKKRDAPDCAEALGGAPPPLRRVHPRQDAGRRRGFPFRCLREPCSRLVAEVPVNVRTKRVILVLGFFCFVRISLIPKYLKV